MGQKIDIPIKPGGMFSDRVENELGHTQHQIVRNLRQIKKGEWELLNGYKTVASGFTNLKAGVEINSSHIIGIPGAQLSPADLSFEMDFTPELQTHLVNNDVISTGAKELKNFGSGTTVTFGNGFAGGDTDVTFKTAIQNGFAALYCGGSGVSKQILQKAGDIGNDFRFFTSQSHSYFFIFKQLSDSDAINTIFTNDHYSNLNGTTVWTDFSAVQSDLKMNCSGSSSIYSATAIDDALSLNTWHTIIVTVDHNAANNHFKVMHNGNLIVNQDRNGAPLTPPGFANDTMALFGNSEISPNRPLTDAYVLALGFKKDALTQSQMQALDTYFANRYGLSR